MAMSKIASNYNIKKVSYYNFLENEERTLDWHAHYVDRDRQTWQIDIIHLMNDSPYAGTFERVTEKISAALTPDIRKHILKIKWDGAKQGLKMRGIEVYKAVIQEHISTLDEFLAWKITQPDESIVMWEPAVKRDDIRER